MTQAILFDFHNTLIRCDAWFEIEVRALCSRFLAWQTGASTDRRTSAEADRRYRILRSAIIVHGHELTAEQCVEAILTDMGLPFTTAELSAGVESIMMATLDQASAIPGALELVRECAETGRPLAIVSNAVYHPFLFAALERLGFDGLFQSIVTSASSGFYKSRPEIYWMALESVGACAERSIHIGDSYPFDVLGGKRAGLATIWLSSDPDAASKSPSPDLIVGSLVGTASAIHQSLAARR